MFDVIINDHVCKHLVRVVRISKQTRNDCGSWMDQHVRRAEKRGCFSKTGQLATVK